MSYRIGFRISRALDQLFSGICNIDAVNEIQRDRERSIVLTEDCQHRR